MNFKAHPKFEFQTSSPSASLCTCSTIGEAKLVQNKQSTVHLTVFTVTTFAVTAIIVKPFRLTVLRVTTFIVAMFIITASTVIASSVKPFAVTALQLAGG